MTTAINLEKLNFGSDDAERDAKDGFLNKVFLKTTLYSRVSNGKRELVIGRKGSGKSALCLTLKNTLEGDGRNTVLVTPKSLSLPKIQQLKVNSISKEEAYILSWKYVLLVKVAIEILSITKQLKSPMVGRSKILLAEIDFFLTANGEMQKSIWQKDVRLLSPFSGLSKFSAKVGIFEAGFESSQKNTQVDTAEILEKFEGKVEELLKVVDQVNLVVLIDKIDEVWNSTEESELMIIGLINAIHTLNSCLQKTSILLFLRSDIYDSLRFNDGDKIRTPEERITWSDRDLKQLITTRGKVSAELDIENIDSLWRLFFEEEVEHEDSFKYILNRTLKRPRELIQFCNLALTMAQDNGHQKILQKDVLSAEGQYSNWKLNDLASEFLVQYPYLKDVLTLFQGFRASFAKNELDSRYQETQKKLTRIYPELHSSSSNSIIQTLFNIGFLGAKINGNEIYFYDDSKIILPQHESIVVHPAFHLALGIKPYSIYISGDYVMGDKISGDKSVAISGNIQGATIITGDVAVGGNVNQFQVGSTINIGDISGSVSQSINQLPSISGVVDELRDLLIQLQITIESDTTLPAEDKAEALEQIIALADAAQNPDEPSIKRRAKIAVKILKGTFAALPKNNELDMNFEKLMPMISRILDL
jgi:energy-coupling factor transporter ATP-binding protein EcfA2